MIQNIIFIILIIIIFFFISNERKINDYISKKYIKYLVILLILYFIYQNYNIVLLIILILIFIFLNIDNNKYLTQVKEYIDNFNTTKNKLKERFSNVKFDVKPYVPVKEEEKEDIENKKKISIEPFKEEVTKLKDLYENIKLEINRLK